MSRREGRTGERDIRNVVREPTRQGGHPMQGSGKRERKREEREGMEGESVGK